MKSLDCHIRLSDDEYGQAPASCREPRDFGGNMPFMDSPMESNGSFISGDWFKSETTTPSFAILVVEAIVPLRQEKETEIANQFSGVSSSF